MIVDVRQLEDVKVRFTELGVALSDLADKNVQTFEDLEKSLVQADERIKDILDIEEFRSLKGATQSISDHAQGLSFIFDKLSTTLGSPIADLEKSISGMGTSFDRINRDLGMIRVPAGKKPGEKGDKKKDKEEPEKVGWIEREKQTFMGMVKRGARILKIPMPGAMIGGIFALAAWGLKDQDRVRQEVGEALNVIESAFDSGVKGLVRRGAQYIGNLGDQMNKFYGISREGVQSVVKGYVDGGIKISSMLSSVDRSFGLVGKNYVTFALGLDKMFELASGESARQMVELMSDYGKDLEGARKSWMSMLMAGKESGIGTARFVKNITTAADSLKELGYDIDNVVNLAVGLQAAYQDMGVPRQMAGQQAALGLQQLAQGMTTMSDAWKRLVGEEMGLGTGLEAKQRFEDVIQRVTTRSESEDADLELQNAILSMVQVASRGGREGELITREILSGEMGLGFKGAQAAMAIKKSVDSGDLKKAAELTKENRKILVSSFETERQKQSKWQRHMNQWLQGLSKIGQGIIGMLGHGLANLIAYFKALIPMIGNYISGDTEANEKILEAIGKFTRGSAGYVKHFKSGFEDLKKASMAAGMEVFGKSLDAIEGAISFNPFVAQGRAPEGIPIGFEGATRAGMRGVPRGTNLVSGTLPLSFGKVPQPIPLEVGDTQKKGIPDRVPVEPMVRTLVIPMEEPGVYPIAPVGYEGEPQFVEGAPEIVPQEAGMPQRGETQTSLMGWVGGGLSIVNRTVGGVNAAGDIVLEVIGNCPRCGLIFGEDSSQMSDYARTDMPVFSEEDEMALARMLRSEVGARRGLEGETRTEAVGIAFTAINRLRSGKYGGSTLSEVITGGEGFGKQGLTGAGRMRPYSTAKEATSESLALAREIMGGYYADPTGGATYFYHSTRGQGYGSKSRPELRTMHPRFTKGKVNVFNINNASFWAPRQLAKQRAADAQEWLEREERRFERVHRQSAPKKAAPEMEEWELETGMSVAE